MTTLTNGMTPTEHLTGLNANLEYFQIAFGQSAVAVSAAQDYITTTNTLMSAIATTCSVTHVPIAYGMKAKTVRDILNSQFALFFASAGFATNQDKFTFPFHYTVENGQLAIIFQWSIADKPLLVEWGDGTSEVVTGLYEDGEWKHITATSNYAQVGTYNVKITNYLKNLYSISLSNGGAEIDVGQLNVFSTLRLALCENSRTSKLIHGSIDNLPSTLGYFAINWYGNVFGDVANLPPTLYALCCQYSEYNNIVGDLADFPSTLYSLDWIGKNGLYGSLNDLPVIMTHWCVTVYDDTLVEAPINPSPGRFTGNLSTFKTSHPDFTYFEGNNLGDDITGSINDLQSGMHEWCLGNVGKTHITGDLAHFPSGIYYLNLQDMGSLIAGNIEDIPISVHAIWLDRTPNVIYGGGAIKAMTIARGIWISNEWTTAMVDAYLIACAASLNSVTAKPFVIAGTNQPRSSASDAAVATLIGKGFLVTTN